MTLKLYQVDSFTNKAFGGNPAAVLILDAWLPEVLMQKIANELNLSETAFLVSHENGYHLRWFTPTREVRLCGHATLASAHILFSKNIVSSSEICFFTLSGELKVRRKDSGYLMSFPKDDLEEITEPDNLQFLQIPFLEAFKGKDDYLLILSDESAVANATPDTTLVKKLDQRGLIISAPGNDTDFVSRCFYPNYGIEEDPVTGSAHTLLTPYWAKKLNKQTLTARQISKRKGDLICSIDGSIIHIFGEAKMIIDGQIYLEE